MNRRVVRCTHCGMRLEAAEAHLGRQGACPRCGELFVVSTQNSFPLDGDAPPLPALQTQAPAPPNPGQIPVQTPAPAPAAQRPATRCARCSREFRGEWDRSSSPEGSICHRCANQYSAAPSQEAPQAAAQPLQQDQAEAFYNPAPVPPPGPPLPQTGMERFRSRCGQAWVFLRRKESGPVIFIAVAAAAFALVMFLPVEDDITALFSQEEGDAGERVIEHWWLIYRAVDFMLGVLRTSILLYALLAIAGKLPNDETRLNVIAVTVVATGLYLLTFLAIFPFWGFIVFVIQVAIIYNLYDLEPGDLLTYLLLHIVSIPAFWAIEKLVHGVLAAVLI